MLPENKCPDCGRIKPMAEWVCLDCGATMPSYGRRDWMQQELGNSSYVESMAPTPRPDPKPKPQPKKTADIEVTWKNAPLVASVVALALLSPWLMDQIVYLIRGW